MFTTRRKPARQFALNVDTLEGRQLLSTVTPGGGLDRKHVTAAIQGNHIGLASEGKMAPADAKKMAPAVLNFGGGGVGRHIGVTADSIQGNHIGMTAAVQGGHVGTGVFLKAELNPQPLPPGIVASPKKM